ncbi:MAG: 8-oxo-dGTP diphosphatase [archaeon]
MKKTMTLCIIQKPEKILLGMKKRGLGEGKWNGFGGKVEENETVKEAAIRELKEEAGVIVDKLEKIGVNEFKFENEDKIFEVHIFKAREFSGDIRESEEMKPQWFSLDEIPFEKMWPDDKFWLPLFLKEKKFRGDFLFQGFDKILEHELAEVGEI